MFLSTTASPTALLKLLGVVRFHTPLDNQTRIVPKTTPKSYLQEARLQGFAFGHIAK
jgi:hypothetical protein